MNLRRPDLVLPPCLGTIGRVFSQRLRPFVHRIRPGVLPGVPAPGPLFGNRNRRSRAYLTAHPCSARHSTHLLTSIADCLDSRRLSPSLCGFGESLDKRFRNDPLVKSTFTYMACGTVPVSWLRRKPFANAKTFCGLWSIESVPGTAKPKEFLDTNGMKGGYRPKPHLVPKLEDLLALFVRIFWSCRPETICSASSGMEKRCCRHGTAQS